MYCNVKPPPVLKFPASFHLTHSIFENEICASDYQRNYFPTEMYSDFGGQVLQFHSE